MIIRSHHRTLYRYGTPSVESHNEVRLHPLTDANQVCRSFSVSTRPATTVYGYQALGGIVHHFGLRGAHRELEIVADAEVETLLTDPFDGLNLLWDDWNFYSSTATAERFAEYLVASPYVRPNGKLSELSLAVRRGAGEAVVDFLLKLSRHLFESFSYDPDVTHVHSTVDEVLELGAGVCQDFAHVMIGCCRTQGIPARYVSGYLYSQQGSDMRGNEAMHAWVECALPDGRWLALDPTNNLLANDLYVRVHVGRDYSEVAPTRGVYMGTPAQSLEVTLSVERVQTAIPPAR
jgi:transglutaminase-like putative cysteine protease